MNFIPVVKVSKTKFYVAMFYVRVFFLIGSILADIPREINPGGNCTRLKCEKVDKNGVVLYYMSGHAIEEHSIFNRSFHSHMDGEESDCLKRCIAIPTCITVLAWEKERKCWFYEGDDVYAKPESIIPWKGSKIISLGNGVCKQQPCNNGKCIPNFDGTGEFTCECHPGFTGARCNKKGAALHFSFDHDTSHTNPALSDVKMELNRARLIRVPDRLGKVLMMKEQDDPITMTVGPESQNKVGQWISNPWPDPKNNLTATFWVKKVGNQKHGRNSIIYLPKWGIAYNSDKKIFMGFMPKIKAPLECPVDQIDSWNHVVFAMSGPTSLVKMYLNGELCVSRDVSYLEPDMDRIWGRPHIGFFRQNSGVSLLDELKFYNSFPQDDDEVRKIYVKEKKGGQGD